MAVSAGIVRYRRAQHHRGHFAIRRDVGLGSILDRQRIGKIIEGSI